MLTEEEIAAVTPDEIAGAILGMLNTLHLLNGFTAVEVPFSDNVADAVARFDRPALRTKLVRLLYSRVAPPTEGADE